MYKNNVSRQSPYLCAGKKTKSKHQPKQTKKKQGKKTPKQTKTL